MEVPEEILREILLRLPIKTLARAKSVCRAWHHNISLQSFQLGRNPIPRVIFGRGFSNKRFYSFEIRGMPQEIIKTAPLPIFHQQSLSRIVGSCNGLICSITVEQQIVVFNPVTVTGVQRIIPRPTGENFTSNVYGFAYKKSSEDYLIYKLGGEYNVEKGEYRSDFELFSLKFSYWKRLEFGIPHGCVVAGADDGVFFQGHMIWNLWNKDDKCYKVLAIDINIQNFLVTSLPLDHSSGISLGVAADYLFVCYHYKDQVDVLQITEYPNLNSTRKVFSHPDPICRSSKARKLIYINVETKLCVFTRGLGMTLSHLSSRGTIMPNHIVKAVVYQESLISPFFRL